jgi:hypothetical protein
MKVVPEQITLLADPQKCELTILTGGLRLVMIGGEACALWSDLGAALEQMYADRPAECPPHVAARLLGRRISQTEEDDLGACIRMLSVRTA